MNTSPSSRPTEHQGLHTCLVDAILFRLQYQIEDELPTEISKDARKDLVRDIVSSSRHTLNQFDLDTLQNECAVLGLIERAIDAATQAADRIMAEGSRS